MKYIISLSFSFLFILQSFAQEKQQLKIADFIGINSNVASYDDKYIDDLAHCTKWIREYHSWGHFEVEDNYYKWDNIITQPQGYTWPDHNKFMDECQKLGINVLIDVLNKPEWAGSERGAYSTGDGTDPNDYLDKLEFMGQLVARYGSQKIDDSKLETADKVSGLNYIKYYEDDNEPDYWWESPKWPAEKYAVYCNAVHDGFGVEPSAEFPLLGIKSVDSTAVHVLGGLAQNNISYIKKILDSSNGRVPFDVVNIHTYCTDDTNGYSPENERYGLEKKLGRFVEWCNNTLPELPIWISEFGWDTYEQNGKGSYIYAPPEQQANYILRSYLVALKMGFGKAFLFMDKDPNSKSVNQYNSSGVLSDKNNGLSKKTSFFYLSAMQKALGNASLDSIVSYREMVDNNEVYCFEFINEANERIYAMWAREANSKTDNGTSLNYKFNLGYQPQYIYSIFPKDKDYDGEKVEHTITGGSIDLQLTETPQFLVVSELKTALNPIQNNELEINIFPNPSKGKAKISIKNTVSQKVNILSYSIEGELVEVVAEEILNSGNHNFFLGYNYKPGLYFIRVKTDAGFEVEKFYIH